mmetsp:Transcript_69637/g.115686  ORF Transcript_69637/g.115686 Transcript_69637/m.115686 type:complete len:131 (+) Transcript_69637:155-547(+)
MNNMHVVQKKHTYFLDRRTTLVTDLETHADDLCLICFSRVVAVRRDIDALVVSAAGQCRQHIDASCACGRRAQQLRSLSVMMSSSRGSAGRVTRTGEAILSQCSCGASGLGEHFTLSSESAGAQMAAAAC